MFKLSNIRPSGFSLLELIISMAISAILLAAAIPGFGYFKAKSDARSVTSGLSRMLAKARSHAIFHSELVTVCGVDAQLECNNEQFDTLIAFIDQNENRIVENDEQTVFQVTFDYQGQLSMRASLNRRYFQFTHNGSSRQAGSFIYCDPNYTNAARRVTVSLSGRSYIAHDQDNDGIVELTNGDPITCN